MLPKINAADIRSYLEKEKARPKDRWGGAFMVDYSSDLLTSSNLEKYAVNIREDFMKMYMCQFKNIEVVTTKARRQPRYDDEKMTWMMELGSLRPIGPPISAQNIGAGVIPASQIYKPPTEAELRAAEGRFNMGLVLHTDANGFLPCDNDELVHIDDVKEWARDSLKGRTTALILMSQGRTVGHRFTFDFDADKVMFKLRWF